MCYLKPLRVKKIKGKVVTLENNSEAFYDRKIGKLNSGDPVIVYGNLIIKKI